MCTHWGIVFWALLWQNTGANCMKTELLMTLLHFIIRGGEKKFVLILAALKIKLSAHLRCVFRVHLLVCKRVHKSKSFLNTWRGSQVVKTVCGFKRRSQDCGSYTDNMLYLETLTNSEVCRSSGTYIMYSSLHQTSSIGGKISKFVILSYSFYLFFSLRLPNYIRCPFFKSGVFNWFSLLPLLNFPRHS